MDKPDREATSASATGCRRPGPWTRARRPLTGILVAALAAAAALAACTAGGEDSGGGKRAKGPWSPQTADILFMSTRGGRNAEIYLRRGADTAWVNLTHSVSRENWPEWSPDGGKIAYQTDKSGRFDIWVMDAQGKNPVQLTEHPDHDLAPAWSADGARIAFTSWRMEAGDTTRGPHLYFMNADGSQEQRLVNSALHTSSAVSWSPDGTKIVYSRGRGSTGADLYLRTLADGAETHLTDSEPYDGGAVFSPDGTQIAFYSDRGNGSSIAILGVDGSGYREVVSTGQNWYPRWSPDGKWLVYAAAESAESPNIDLFAVPAVGGTPIPVVTGPDREVEGRWRP